MTGAAVKVGSCKHLLNQQTLINVESDIRTFLRNRGSLERYFGFFGERPITQQLYDGLWNSYNAYFKDKSNDDQNIQIQLESQLKKLSNRIEAL